MIDNGDLNIETSRILDRLDALERRQMLANSRIRQDLASVVIGIFLPTFIGIAIWREYEWSWWYPVTIAMLVPVGIGYLVSRVQKQEER